MNEKRIAQLRQMQAQDPEDPFFPYAIGQEYISAGEFEQASSTFEELLEKFVEYIPAYHHLGIAYFQLEQLDDAIRVLKKGIELAQKQENRKAKAEMEQLLDDIVD